MSNDPKDAVVDLSKLVKKPAKSNAGLIARINRVFGLDACKK